MIVASVTFEPDGCWRAEVQATDGNELLIDDVVSCCVRLVTEVQAGLPDTESDTEAEADSAEG